MGRDTNITLYSLLDESEAVAQINAWCTARWDFCDPIHDKDICTRPACACTARAWFRLLDVARQKDNYSGHLWVACGRNIDYRELLDVWDTFPWRWPSKVMLVVDDEWDHENGSPEAFRLKPGAPKLIREPHRRHVQDMTP